MATYDANPISPDPSIVKENQITGLPGYLRTPQLQKIFDISINQMFQTENSEAISGYIGRKNAPNYNGKLDFYITSQVRKNPYQLEPTSISRSTADASISSVTFYEDLVNQIRFQGGNVTNESRIFEQEYYSWCPPIDSDKLVNFANYYWVTYGPTAVTVLQATNAQLNILGQKTATINDYQNTGSSANITLTNGMVLLFKNDAVDAFNNKIFIVEGVGKGIMLIDDTENAPIGQYDIPKYDTTPYDANFEDADIKFKTTYVVMERGAKDRNEWSLVNRWFHKDVIDAWGVSLGSAVQAARPIIEFDRDLELRDMGLFARGNVDVIDMLNEPAAIIGQKKFFVEGIELVNGMRMLFTNSTNQTMNNRIYQVIKLSANSSIQLNLVTDGQFQDGSPAYGDKVRVRLGYHSGKEFYFNGLKWVSAQQRVNTYDPPLFNLYDSEGIRLDDTGKYPNSKFVGNKCFSFKINTARTIDSVLGIQVDRNSFDQIIFSNNLVNDRQYYRPSTSNDDVEIIGNYYLKKYDSPKTIITGTNQNPVIYAGDVITINKVKVTSTSSNLQDLVTTINNAKITNIVAEVFDNRIRLINNVGNLIYLEQTAGGIVDNLGLDYISFSRVNYLNDWNRAAEHSQQKVVDEFILRKALNTVTNVMEIPRTYTLSQTVSFGTDYTTDPCDIYLNQKKLLHWTDYTITNGNKLNLSLTLSINEFDYLRAECFGLTPKISGSTGFYEIAKNIQSNPNNENITEIGYNELFEHMLSIIQNQPDLLGVIGNAFGPTKFRDSSKDKTVGTTILQHSAPLIRLMHNASRIDADVADAIIYVEREHNRYRTKFYNAAQDYYQNFTTSTYLTSWIDQTVSKLALGSSTDSPWYNSKMATTTARSRTWMPPTPASMGILPAYKPETFVDKTFVTPKTVIRLHDGSFIDTVFGDNRDAMLLAFENDIYNSINSSFKGEVRPLLDPLEIIPGYWRTKTRYTRIEFNRLIQTAFERFVKDLNLDYRTNTTYNGTNAFTWNYSSQFDGNGNRLPGHWRGIYQYYFDTDRPHSHPWEMLGFTSRPGTELETTDKDYNWWEKRYGAAPYTSGNIPMWTDIANGFIAAGPRQGTYDHLKRSQLLTMIPVDSSGNLLDPVTAGICGAPTAAEAGSKWAFGDNGPIETYWRRSQHYPFALTYALYLAHPAKFYELNLFTGTLERIFKDQYNSQIIDKNLLRRPSSSDLYYYGEIDTSTNTTTYSEGLSQFIGEYLISTNKNVKTEYAEFDRSLDAQIASKMNGFVDVQNLSVIADNFGALSNQDYDALVVSSASTRELTYSAVIVEWTGSDYMVYGYDASNPNFTIAPSNPAGAKTTVTVNTTTVNKYLTGDGTTATVPYYTKYNSIQGVYDFLISHQRQLVADGWVFDQVDISNATIDFEFSALEYLLWVQNVLTAGNNISFSPLAREIKIHLKTPGVIAPVNKFVNGVYSILDSSSQPVDFKLLTIFRTINEIDIKVPNSTNIYLMKAGVIEYDHALIFDNVTSFNDLIYIPRLGIRQARFKVDGTRTRGWTGQPLADGYIISDNNIVRNLEKSTATISRLYDATSSNEAIFKSETRHITGYQNRSYLDELELSEDGQFDFYSKMLRQKGTANAFDKLLRSTLLSSQTDELDVQEYWAMRLSKFGAIEYNNSIEFKIPQSQIRANPQIVYFTTGTTDDLTDDVISITQADSRWIKKNNSVNQNRFDVLTTNFMAQKLMPNSGYVALGDTTYYAVNDSDLDTLYTTANNLSKPITDGYTVWTFITKNGADWTVSRVSSVAYAMQFAAGANPGDPTTITMNAHGLAVGDRIMIVGSTGTQPEFEGNQTVSEVLDANTFRIKKSSTTGTLFNHFLAVGDTAKAATTLDATTWTQRTTGLGSNNLTSSIYANSIYLIAGANGSMAKSNDGTTWSSVTSGFGSTTINNIAYGLSNFIIVGDTGKLSLSTTGTTWNSVTTGFGSDNIKKVTVGNNTAVIVGANGKIATSTDLYSWSLKTSGFGSTTINSIAYGNGKFVAVGNSSKVSTSTDSGNTWTLLGSTPFTSDAINDVVWAEALSLFVIVGANGKLSTSPDGITWTSRTSGFTSDTINAVAYDSQSKLLAIAGANGKLATSSDGINWTLVTSSFGSTNIQGLVPINRTRPFIYNLYTVRYQTRALSPIITGNTPHNGWVAGDLIWIDDARTSTEITNSATPYWAVFKRNLANNGWDQFRVETSMVNSKLIEKALIYSNKNYRQQVNFLPVDPIKGIIPGMAVDEIDYLVEIDPAKYTNGDAALSQIDPELAWGPEQVGRLWWNYSTVRFAHYEQGDLNYRRKNWGKILPGTSVDIYEWVRSPVAPTGWVAYAAANQNQSSSVVSTQPSGTPYLDAKAPYVVRDEYVQNGTTQKFYYFWIKNPSYVPYVSFRKTSALSLSAMISDPTAAGIEWFAPIESDAFLITNASQNMTDDSIIQINYYTGPTDYRNVHSQWILFSEKEQQAQPPLEFWNKMRDSVTGWDESYLPVPDLTLDPSIRYGTKYRPRQGWFKNKLKAREILVKKINTLFQEFDITDEINNWDQHMRYAQELSDPVYEILNANVAIFNAGTGYVVGDTLTLVGGIGSAATAVVYGIGVGGSITNIYITYTGAYTTAPSASPSTISLSGGTGSSATLTAVPTLKPADKQLAILYEVLPANATIYNVDQGTGYVAGDQLIVEGGIGDPMRITVSTVGGSGQITAYSVTSKGIYFDPPVKNYPPARKARLLGGTGTGAKITVTPTTKTFSYTVDSRAAMNELPNLVAMTSGATVYVKSDEFDGGKWSLWVYNGSPNMANKFALLTKQLYRMEDFWDLTDWYSTGYSSLTRIDKTFIDIFERNQYKSFFVGQIIKVLNDSTGKWLLQYVSAVDNSGKPTFIKIGRQNSTIQLKSKLYSFSTTDTYFNNSIPVTYGAFTYYGDNFDMTTITSANIDTAETRAALLTLYQEAESAEVMKRIIFALRPEIRGKVYASDDRLFNPERQTSLLFSGINYAHTEQLVMDWVFKTSIINVTGQKRDLNQAPLITKDYSTNFDAYINETKPYHVKLKGSVERTATTTETASVKASDFDTMNNTILFDRVGVQPTILQVKVATTSRVDFSGPPNLVDGIVLNTGDLVLLKDQSTASDVYKTKKNGVYIYTAGSPGTLTRYNMVDGTPYGEVFDGMIVYVQQGQINGSTAWFWRGQNGGIVIDTTNEANTTPITFEPYTVAGTTPYRLTAADRILLHYKPSPDEQPKIFEKLISGAEFRGTTLDGQAFYDYLLALGYDANMLDNTFGYDAGQSALDDFYDAWVSGKTFLSGPTTNAEDIIVQGNKFLQPYLQGGHPEELVPVKPTDCVDIRVYTLTPASIILPGYDSDPYDTQPYDNGVIPIIQGNPFVTTNRFYGNGTTGPFTVPGYPQSADAIFIYKNGIELKLTTDYTLSKDMKTVTLVSSASTTDVVQIMSYGKGGSQVTRTRTYTNTNLTVFDIGTSASNANQILVTVDGAVASFTFSAPSTITITSPAPSNSTVNITVFADALKSVSRKQSLTYANVNTIAMTYPQTSAVPPEASVIVTVDGKRIRPPEFRYHTVFDITNKTYRISRTPGSTANVKVWTNLDESIALLTQGVDYTVVGNNIVLTNNPAARTLIVVALYENYEYTVTGGNLVLNAPFPAPATTALTNGVSKIEITTFSEDKSMRMRTEVYDGAADGIYPIFTLPYNDQFSIVTLNGNKSLPGYDYEFNSALASSSPVYIYQNSNTALGPCVHYGVAGDPTTDKIIITTMIGVPAREAVAFRMTKTAADGFEYRRISDDNTTYLAAVLNDSDTTVTVTDATVLSQPNLSAIPPVPGVIWVGTERIKFFTVDTSVAGAHVLGQITRGTRGSGMLPSQPVNTIVRDAGENQTIPGGYSWFATPLGMQLADNDITRFLLQKRGTYEFF